MKIRIFDKEWRIEYSSDPSEVNRAVDKRAEACYGCHAQAQSLPVWPEFNLEHGEAQTAELGRLWRDYLDEMLPAHLSRTTSYKNSSAGTATNVYAV